MNRPPVFFIAMIALITIAASFRYLHQRRQNAENDAAPLMQKKVLVATKREKPVNDRRSRQQQVTPAGTAMDYEVWFQPQGGGMVMKMRLKAVQYHEMAPGDEGVLSYKGTRFISFVPEASHLP